MMSCCERDQVLVEVYTVKHESCEACAFAGGAKPHEGLNEAL